MKQFYELPPERLKRTCNVRMLHFSDTSELEPLQGMIGQDRAMKAMDFGLNIDSFGYNIFMVGRQGTGKMSYACDMVNKKASNGPIPDDICYVYNFDNIDQPIALNFKHGSGKDFVKNMDELINDLQVQIPKVFNSSDYDKQKQNIVEKFKNDRDSMLEKLNALALEKGFTIKWTNTGFLTVPMVDGKIINEEEYMALPEDIRKEIDNKSEQVNKQALQTMKNIIKREKKLKQDVDKLDEKTAMYAVGRLIDELKSEYKEHEKVLKFLENMQKDVLINLAIFREVDEEKPDYMHLFKPSKDSMIQKYKVNLFIDNSSLEGAPVVCESNPNYYNLLGRVEYENNMGVATTNFLKIKPGALHRANGGYLIVQIKDILTNPLAYEGLKRALKDHTITTESMGDSLGLIATSSLRPEPIPLDIKVVAIGNPWMYGVLYHYDEDFRELFKVKADFNSDMEYNKENVLLMSRFIASSDRRKHKHLMNFKRDAVARVIEYCTRLSENQNKLTTRFNEISELLNEANAYADMDGATMIGKKHVEKALSEKIARLNKYEEQMDELYEKNILMVETSGSRSGQINGLSVLQMGDYVFGKPSKITVNTWGGKRGITNIEREIDMSGQSHSKGVLILSGYFCEKFGHDRPITLSATICFEQLYSGVDGDSASSTELYALLSSLSSLPIQQNLAVTGSVNQKGEVQPIGGVTYKIEGFFKLCNSRGLDGSHGVIIPYQNVEDLVLNDDVVKAVKEGKFHIYPVKTVEEGIEILTGVPAGSPNEKGEYPKDSVFGKVQKKLEQFAKMSSHEENGENDKSAGNKVKNASKKRKKEEK